MHLFICIPICSLIQLTLTLAEQDLDGESIADLLKGKSLPARPPRIFLHHCRKHIHAARLVTGHTHFLNWQLV